MICFHRNLKKTSKTKKRASGFFLLKINLFRKVELIEFACKTWQLFLRIFALVKFKRKGHINVSVSYFEKKKTIELIIHLFSSKEYNVIFESTKVHFRQYG